MKIKFQILSIFIVFIFASCNNSFKYDPLDLNDKYDYLDLSDLKTAPKKYDNDTIKIRGTLFIEFENVSIEQNDLSIWIDNFSPAIDVNFRFGDEIHKKLNGKSVTLIGIYKEGKTGHLSRYNGKFIETLFLETH